MDASEANIRDYGGTVDSKKNRIQCNFCKKVVCSFSRLKCHLGGVGPDVKACAAVPADVKKMWRNKLLGRRRDSLGREVGELYHPDRPRKRKSSHRSKGAKRKKGHTSKSSRYQTDSEEDTESESEYCEPEHVSSPNGATDPHREGNSDTRADSISMSPQRCIGRFFYETGLEFSAASSPSFKKMLNSIVGPAVKYQFPSSEELKGCILQDEVKEMKEYVSKIRESWATTGCSILLDSWVDEKGRNLVNFLVNCPRGPIYLCTHDVSSIIGYVDALHLLMESIIKDVGVENVIQVVADSTTGWVGTLRNEFVNRRKEMYWAVSASHCIELMLDKIGMTSSIRRILDKAKVITKFIHGHEEVLKLLKKHTLGRDLINPSKIRGAMPFMTLENIVSEKQKLEDMVASIEWNLSIWASRAGAKRVKDLVEDESFWTGAATVLKAAMPLVGILELIFEAAKPYVGMIYEIMDQVKEKIKENFEDREPQYMPIWEIIDDVWNKILHIPLHGAGYFLNPVLKYSRDFYCDDEVLIGLMCCIGQRNLSINDLTPQLKLYVESAGSFEENSSPRNNISPDKWWSSYGKQCPELQRFAIQILSQTCDGAAKYGLKRTMAEKLVTNGRNPIEQQWLSDLAFVHYNLQLQKFCSGENTSPEAEDIDPMDDWIVDDTPDTVPPFVELNSGLADGARNGEGPSRLQPKTEPM